MDPEHFKTVDNYITCLFPSEDNGLEAARQSIEEAHLDDMSISANQGRFLHVLAKLCKAKKILELGTFAGYSTIWLARALPSDGRLVTLEHDETLAAIAIDNFIKVGLENLIEVRVGKALELLPKILEEEIGPFDMIFIDADKPPYAEYFQWALRLSLPGTLIVVDNVIRHVFDGNTPVNKKIGVERFNALLCGCADVTAAIIQTVGIKEHDGMAIAVVN